MAYIIDMEIYFDTHKNKLFFRKDPSRYVILTVPAAQCLGLLLEKSPVIVPHDIFIENVWGNNGTHVSPNTLYQNISMVRRALREVSNKDVVFIKTIKRKGFQFNEHITIEIEDEDEDDVLIPESDNVNIANTIVQEIKWNKFYLFKFIILSLTGFLVGQIPMFLLTEAFDDKTTFDEYSMITNYNGCSIFYENHDINSAGLTERLKSKIDYFDIDCNENPVIYISTYSAGPEFTALLCKNKIKSREKVNCESIHYKKDNTK